MPVDFSQMVLAHARWKTRLRDAIQSGEAIDANLAGKDDQCEMGKWVYGEGATYASLPAYADLKAKHAKFHACVAEVLRQMRSSTAGESMKLIDPVGSEFGRCSVACINAIAALRDAIPSA